jgi:hypothetical protein
MTDAREIGIWGQPKFWRDDMTGLRTALQGSVGLLKRRRLHENEITIGEKELALAFGSDSHH